MKLLAIGSIIEIKSIKLCIIGYTSKQVGDVTHCGYYAVPYPIGYMNTDKTVFIPAEAPVNVIAEGYSTEESQGAIDLLGVFFESSKVMPAEQIDNIVAKYKNAVDKLRGEGK